MTQSSTLSLKLKAQIFVQTLEVILCLIILEIVKFKT